MAQFMSHMTDEELYSRIRRLGDNPWRDIPLIQSQYFNESHTDAGMHNEYLRVLFGPDTGLFLHLGADVRPSVLRRSDCLFLLEFRAFILTGKYQRSWSGTYQYQRSW